MIKIMRELAGWHLFTLAMVNSIAAGTTYAIYGYQDYAWLTWIFISIFFYGWSVLTRRN